MARDAPGHLPLGHPVHIDRPVGQELHPIPVAGIRVVALDLVHGRDRHELAARHGVLFDDDRAARQRAWTRFQRAGRGRVGVGGQRVL